MHSIEWWDMRWKKFQIENKLNCNNIIEGTNR